MWDRGQVFQKLPGRGACPAPRPGHELVAEPEAAEAVGGQDPDRHVEDPRGPRGGAAPIGPPRGPGPKSTC